VGVEAGSASLYDQIEYLVVKVFAVVYIVGREGCKAQCWVDAVVSGK